MKKVKLRKSKNKISEGFQMGGANPVGLYTGGYNPQGNVVFNNPAPYTYEIVPLNTSLSQKGNSIPNEVVVHRGTRIKGVSILTGEECVGRVDTIVKDGDGYIRYLIVLDENSRKFVKVSDDNVYILK